MKLRGIEYVKRNGQHTISKLGVTELGYYSDNMWCDSQQKAEILSTVSLPRGKGILQNAKFIVGIFKYK